MSLREWRPDWPCPVDKLLNQHRHGMYDPTLRVAGGDPVWRASRTPNGPVCAQITPLTAQGVISAKAWGPGRDWFLEQLPLLLGSGDDISGFDPLIPLVEKGHRRSPHWRFSSSGLIFEALVPAILEQQVCVSEAWASWSKLVRQYGEPAPGPGRELGLVIPPAPETISQVSSWDWLQMGVTASRAETLVSCAKRASAIDRLAGRAGDCDSGLRSLPGVGIWTSAETRARALGDRDAVSFGDLHLARQIGFTVQGAPFDDVELREFLTPWAGQRGRVVRCLLRLRVREPRTIPKAPRRRHLPRARG